jgi:hypothetical protein
MLQAALFPAPVVTVPTHPTGERFSIQLFTVEGTSYGPYVGLPLQSHWTGYTKHLFTAQTARQIIDDLHADECGMTGEFAEDGTLTVEWTIESDGEGGQAVITPDRWGRYLIGDLWAWDNWSEDTEQTEYQRAYALGAAEYRQASRGPLLSASNAAAYYESGRTEAHELTLHLDDTPGHALNALMDEYGIAGETDDDMANSWLVFPYALANDEDEFDGTSPHIVAFVSVEGEAEVFVDETLGERRGTWHVRTATEAMRDEREVLTVDAAETERVAAFIADLLIVP